MKTLVALAPSEPFALICAIVARCSCCHCPFQNVFGCFAPVDVVKCPLQLIDPHGSGGRQNPTNVVQLTLERASQSRTEEAYASFVLFVVVDYPGCLLAPHLVRALSVVDVQAQCPRLVIRKSLERLVCTH